MFLSVLLTSVADPDDLCPDLEVDPDPLNKKMSFLNFLVTICYVKIQTVCFFTIFFIDFKILIFFFNLPHLSNVLHIFLVL